MNLGLDQSCCTRCNFQERYANEKILHPEVQSNIHVGIYFVVHGLGIFIFCFPVSMDFLHLKGSDLDILHI